MTSLHTTSLHTVKPSDVSWLWPGRIPRGKVTLLAGDPGLGKSFVTMDLAARVSRAAEWPDGPTALRQVFVSADKLCSFGQSANVLSDKPIVLTEIGNFFADVDHKNTSCRGACD